MILVSELSFFYRPRMKRNQIEGMKNAFWCLSFVCMMLLVSCKNPEKNVFYELFSIAEATKASNYNKLPNWTENVFLIDEARLDFVKSYNRLDEFEANPKIPSGQELQEFRDIFQSIYKTQPDIINKILNWTLYGIYLCHGCGGTGLTGFVYKGLQPVGGFVVLNTEWLQSSANEWITKKEATVFQIPRSWNLEIKIEDRENNNRENAVRYILLHELGHIISVVERQLPDYREEYRDYTHSEFARGLWITDTKSIFDSRVFKRRPQVHFYGKSKLKLDSDWNDIYPILQNRTPFPTLYSAISLDDHFAESFVSYCHVVLEGKPWSLQISKNGKSVWKMGNGILEERSRYERETISQIVDRYSL